MQTISCIAKSITMIICGACNVNVIFLPNKSLENNGECAVRSTVGVVPALVLRSLHRFLAVFQLIVRHRGLALHFIADHSESF